jgi:hypothetical protein
LNQNTLPEGATVTETTYFDAGNTAYGTGTQLASATFTSIGTSTPAPTLVNAMGPYSIIDEYEVALALSAPPTALSTISLTTATDRESSG